MTVKVRRKRKADEAPAPPPRTVWDYVSGLVEGRTRVVVASLAVVHVILCLALFDPKIHTGGDSSAYILLSESILQPGDGYSLSIEPGPPEVQTKFPPGYPILLAPLVALFGRNIVVLKMLSVFFTTGAILVFCAYAKRGREPLLWLSLALAFAVSPGVIDYSRWVLSEAPFLFFTLLSLWFLHEEPRDKIGRAFGLGLIAAVASFYIRATGALLLAAASLSYLARGEWRKFLVHGAVGGSLTIPWLVRNRFAAGAATPYLEEFRLGNVYTPETGYLDWFGMAERFFLNGQLYATRELPRAIVGSDSDWAATPLVDIVSLIVCGLAVAGVIRALRTRPAAAEIYLVLTCLAIMLFQESVNDIRYLVPIIPLVLVSAVDGATWLVRAARRSGPLSLVPVYVATVLAGLGLAAQAARIPASLDMVVRVSAGNPYEGYHPAWKNFFETADWVSRNTADDAVVTVRKPRLFHLLTNRKVRLYPFSPNPDSVLGLVLSTDYVVVDAIHPTTQRYLVPAIQQAPDNFGVAYATEQPVTEVLTVNRGDPPRGPERQQPR